MRRAILAAACALCLMLPASATASSFLDRKLEDWLHDLTTAKKPAGRRSAAFALGRLGERAAIPPLIELLKSPEEKIRYSAVYALGDLATKDDQNVIIALRPLLEDIAPNVRDATQAALAKIEL